MSKFSGFDWIIQSQGGVQQSAFSDSVYTKRDKGIRSGIFELQCKNAFSGDLVTRQILI